MSALAQYPVTDRRLRAADLVVGMTRAVPRRTDSLSTTCLIPANWSEVVLKGIQIGLANPMFKNRLTLTATMHLASIWSRCRPTLLPRPSTDMPADRDPLLSSPGPVDRLIRTGSTRRYTEFYRLAWRRQIAPNTERSLYAAIIPPGPAHVDFMRSLALSDNSSTVLAAGFWSSLPLDYFVRITGKAIYNAGIAKTLPFGSHDHPLAHALLLRTMRLNCLTDAYSDLWTEVYDRRLAYGCLGLLLAGSTVAGGSRSDLGLRTHRCVPSALAGPLLSRSTPWSRSGSAWTWTL